MWNFGYSTSIPFLLIFAGGYFYVGFSSLHALYKMHREAQAAAEAEDARPAGRGGFDVSRPVRTGRHGEAQQRDIEIRDETGRRTGSRAGKTDGTRQISVLRLSVLRVTTLASARAVVPVFLLHAPGVSVVKFSVPRHNAPMALLQLPHTAGCIVCGPLNPHGLHLSLFVDPATAPSTPTFTPQPAHIGFEGVVHGGVLATVLDEAMVWCATWSGQALLPLRRTLRPLPHPGHRRAGACRSSPGSSPPAPGSS